MSTCAQAAPEGVILRVVVQPKASKSEIVGEHGEEGELRLKIRIAAPPVDGEANEELLRFLKKALKALAPASIELVRGAASRKKDVLVRGVDLSSLLSLISNSPGSRR